MGYFWSIWYVPNEYRDFQYRYDMKHIPHITAITNLKERPSQKDLSKWPPIIDFLTFTSELYKMTQSYENDPLFGSGWNCTTVPKLDVKHNLHLTHKYYENADYELDNFSKPPQIIGMKRVVADTRDDDPSKWYFMV